MRRATIFIGVVLIATSALAEDLVLVNGTVIDGTLKARFQGNVRLRNGEIAEIGAFKPAAGETVLDVKGLIVAPGFIDLHNHSENAIDKSLGAVSQISQGITTAVLGSDGSGPYAVEDFMLPFDEKLPALNIATFVGHGTVRRQIMGANYKRAATADEIDRMGQLVESAMREGAFGLSSGLDREPGSYSTTEELIALAKIMARYGGTYTTHVRDEGSKVIDSIKEAIEIGRAAKVPVQISSIKLGADSVWGKTAQVLAEIDKARSQGVDVAADIYPYTESNLSEKDVRAFLLHAWVMIASDGGLGIARPGSAGAFPRVLGSYVREQKVLTLERAIRKMSGLPASRLGMKERGVLAKGSSADIVVFDPLQIRDNSTPQDPFAVSAGLKYVFVNGTMVIKDGQPTGERPGRALR
jgi:N-acyl-D-amino-acid deacylase